MLSQLIRTPGNGPPDLGEGILFALINSRLRVILSHLGSLGCCLEAPNKADFELPLYIDASWSPTTNGLALLSCIANLKMYTLDPKK